MYNKSFILLFSLLIFSSCNITGQVKSKAFEKLLENLLSHTVTEVEVDDISQSADDIVYLDAREIEEFDVSHIKGAQYVGYDNFDMELTKDIPKDAQIIVYCSIGYRSEKISEKLIEQGFTDVSNLVGGIFEWKNQGNPVYVDEEETDKVHAFDKTWGVWLDKGKKVYK